MVIRSNQGNFHQGDSIFIVASRGRLCSCMTLSARLSSQYCPVQTWTQSMIDNILFRGNHMYLQALDANTFPEAATLLLSHLLKYGMSIDGSFFNITYSCSAMTSSKIQINDFLDKILTQCK